MNDTNTAVPAFSMVSHYIALAVLFSVYFSAKGELTIFAFGGTLEPTIFKREVGNEANNEDCCLPTHNIKRTKEQIDADKERDRNITEECEKEVQEILSEAGALDDPMQRIECNFECGYKKLQVFDDDGELIRILTLKNFLEIMDSWNMNIFWRSGQKCWRKFQANLNSTSEGHACHPATKELADCVNEIKVLYCKDESFNNNDRCLQYRQTLKQKYESH